MNKTPIAQELSQRIDSWNHLTKKLLCNKRHSQQSETTTTSLISSQALTSNSCRKTQPVFRFKQVS